MRLVNGTNKDFVLTVGVRGRSEPEYEFLLKKDKATQIKDEEFNIVVIEEYNPKQTNREEQEAELLNIMTRVRKAETKEAKDKALRLFDKKYTEFVLGRIRK